MSTLHHAGAVAYRTRGGEAEFLLVTSQRGRWIFPKGRIEAGSTPEATAVRETREEAGIEGKLHPKALGVYRDKKSDDAYNVKMYLLEYKDNCDVWEERKFRSRKWCTYEQAVELIRKAQVLNILELARGRILEKGLGVAPKPGGAPAKSSEKRPSAGK
jgi:8-oxo-dGTP pyrophosphatase MutT (NUDIX family)